MADSAPRERGLNVKNIVLMSSAAAVALLVAAGSAQAADVMPIVVPVVTPVVVVPPPGPVKTLRIDTTLAGSPMGLDLQTLAGVDVRTASGWGFQLVVANDVFLDGPPVDGFLSAEGRVYRAIGNGTVGVFASTGAIYALGVGAAGLGVALGIDADYKTDDVELFYALSSNFLGGFDGVQSIFAASVDRGNFKVDMLSIVSAPPLGGFTVVKAGYSFGSFTPYVLVAGGGTFGGGFGVALGAGLDFEHEVGERLTLTANAEFGFDIGPVPDFAWTAEAGFEYNLDAVGGPLYLRGEVDIGSTGGVAFQIGIGLKFGAGRITGLGGILFDDLPGDFEL